MKSRFSCVFAILLAVLLLDGCATRFNSGVIRDELTRQSGRDPLTTFEFNLGRFTTFMLKSALDLDENSESPFAGLDQLQLAVFEAQPGSGPAMDVTQITVRGWEQVLRFTDRQRSGMVLIKASGDDIGDLVVVGAGNKNVLYARLRGRLSAELPKALGESLQNDGPDALRQTLTQLGASE